jgi:Family of unknown function (DUF6492)
MTSLAIITPSYAADFDLCADLNASVRRFAPSETDHHIVVPNRDVALFGRLRGQHTHVHEVADFLPRRFVALPGNYWINLNQPVRLVRGWIIQQLLKLSVAAALECEAALLVDSDVRFIRPLRIDTFVSDRAVRFYRGPKVVDEELLRRLAWHMISRGLVGLGPLPNPPHADYRCWPVPWDPSIVRSLLARIEEVAGLPWPDAITPHADFCVATLYGVFVDEVLRGSANATADMLCHRPVAGTAAMDDATMAAFLAGIGPHDVAVMISASSGTPLLLRRTALHGLSPYA